MRHRKLESQGTGQISEEWRYNFTVCGRGGVIHFEKGSHLLRIFHRVLDALVSEDIYYTYIRLPNDSSPIPPEIEDNPKIFPYFKDIVGAIDGSLISAHVPTEDQQRYRSRKGHICQNVMAVVSMDGKFIYLLTGWEGSAADSTVYNDAVAAGLVIPRGRMLLADAGFAICEALLVPYRGVRYHLREWHLAKFKYVSIRFLRHPTCY